jgi:alkylation response protein AidB-like acyl-CoA dehydrogenase
MNFDFSEDQREIKRTARDLLAGRSSFAAVRAAAETEHPPTPDPALAAELGELGWPGIAISEEHGGLGLGAVELGILLEELGYACAATPFLGSVLAALAIEHAGSDAQRARWLPGLASGELRGALGPAGGLIPDAPGAAVVVLLDGDGDGGATLLDTADAAVPVETVATIDPTRASGRVAATAAAGEALPGDVGAAVDRAAIAVSAELVGVSQRALELTLAYVKERRQFDTPVGAFQAVSHRCAQMLLHTESARSATYYAGWAADADPQRLPEAAALAKSAASEAGREVTASAIQAHGGIGFTWEADVHWLYKRAQLDAAFLGGSAAHRVRLARLLGARIGAASA